MIELALFWLFAQSHLDRANALLEEISKSGRLVYLLESSSERVELKPLVAPGAPPLLSFRYFEGRERHRFGQLDLVLDDAGH